MKSYLSRHIPLSSCDIRCNTEKGLISVILPVYNCEKYIEESINSVLSQTWAALLPFFFIIRADNSLDKRNPSFLSQHTIAAICAVFLQDIQVGPCILCAGTRRAVDLCSHCAAVGYQMAAGQFLRVGQQFADLSQLCPTLRQHRNAILRFIVKFVLCADHGQELHRRLLHMLAAPPQNTYNSNQGKGAPEIFFHDTASFAQQTHFLLLLL